MYSRTRSTSALYPSYTYHKKHSSDEKPQPGFGEHHNEQFNDQLHSAMNPSYLTPASYSNHPNQNNGFGVQRGLMTNNEPFYHLVKNSSYLTPISNPMHQIRNYLVKNSSYSTPTNLMHHNQNYSVKNSIYLSSTSNPMYQNRNHGFGVQQSSMMNIGPFNHPLEDPGYSTPTSYLMNHNQSYLFTLQQSSMRNNRPFYHPGYPYHPPENVPTYLACQPATTQAQEAPTYPVCQPVVAQAQQGLTYPARQPAAQAQEASNYPVGQYAAAQVQEASTYLVCQSVAAQAPQIELKRNADEEFLEVNLERPVLSKSKPRLRWTPELHERFIRAATELGGVAKATPKTILEKMNLRGLTLDHLKSHLQKTRDKNRNDILVEEIIGHDEGSTSHAPHYEPDTGNYGSLLRSSEIPNYQQNLRNALGENHANYV